MKQDISAGKFILIRRTRAVTGLLMLAFVVSHLTNLSLGLISVAAMDAARPVLSGFWTGPILGPLLGLALVVHFCLGLYAIYIRPTLQTDPQDIVQLVSGILVIPLLATHVIGVSMVGRAGIDLGYAELIKLFWIDLPSIGLLQVCVLTVVWLHGCAGLLTWMRSSARATRILPWIYPLAVAIPVIALLGYAEAGRNVLVSVNASVPLDIEEQEAYKSEAPAQYESEGSYPDDPAKPPPYALIKSITFWTIWGSAGLTVLTFLARFLRTVWRENTPVTIVLQDERALPSYSHLSVLDGLRINDQPHANLCAGRGRCGTCAVRVLDNEFELPEASDLEKQTLLKIHAPEGARLACQLNIAEGRISIVPLYPPDFTFDEDDPAQEQLNEASL